jgi:hypothetical protein
MYPTWPVETIDYDGDYWSGSAQFQYEANIVDEARAIVDGGHAGPPQIEHLRVLLSWLDGARINNVDGF